MMVDFVDVVLVDAGADRIAVIKAIREVTFDERVIRGVDLATAKRFTDTAPCVVIPNVPAEVGERVQLKLGAAGATVELKPA
jgi:large subunit ribosomal protein L7/L12